MVLVDRDSTREQKDSAVSNYLFERGQENASFLMELFRHKGQHTKETRVFKSQIRFDFDHLCRTMARLFKDIGEGIKKDKGRKKYANLGQRFIEGGDLLVKAMEKIAHDRMREQGWGIYVNQEGKIYSIRDNDFDEAIAMDKKNGTKQTTTRKKDNV
jgi:hypothetical protein